MQLMKLENLIFFKKNRIIFLKIKGLIIFFRN